MIAFNQQLMLPKGWNNSYNSTETVIQFGQRIPNPNLKECPEDLIPIKDVLTQFFMESEECHYDAKLGMGALETWYGIDIEETSDCGNTYNWSAPIQNDINW